MNLIIALHNFHPPCCLSGGWGRVKGSGCICPPTHLPLSGWGAVRPPPPAGHVGGDERHGLSPSRDPAPSLP